MLEIALLVLGVCVMAHSVIVRNLHSRIKELEKDR